MKQLTVFEMEEISGGYTWDFSSLSSAITSLASNAGELVISVALGAAVGAMAGSVIGGVHGGDGGGLLGIGSIGQGVGMIWGLVVGAIGCGIAAATVGWDQTLAVCLDVVGSVIDGTFAPW
ncbi:hypothetical protein I6U06_23375 [Klebsiella pneumoniae]|uniref:hypothetical protein n=1 Tax=Klebsiella pneumoniae TaxID=573 RepID=UPI0022EACC99|nr:hypothetical protein [Klebsiella pneumoniae]MDA3144928.1 hypothetical protein [Klebsiella pneumoniae]